MDFVAQCALNFENYVAARGCINPSAALDLEVTCVRSKVPFYEHLSRLVSKVWQGNKLE